MTGTVAGIDQPLASAERLEFCHQESLRALERADWAGALARQEELKRLIDALTQSDPSLGAELWRRYGDLMNTVLARLHGVLIADADPPLPALPRAQLCWQLHRLLQEHHLLPIERPDWLPVLETQLVQDAAFYWRELIEERPEAAARSLALFERLNELLTPVPDWVGVFVAELRAQQPAEPAAAEPISAEPEVIRHLVHDWLLSHGGQRSGVGLGLVVVPGAAAVSRDPRRLDLNVAPLLELREPRALEEGLAAFMGPLQALGHGTALEVRDPWSSLYESLGYLWRLGESLDRASFHQLTRAASLWSRQTGPGSLGAKLLPSGLELPPLAEPGLHLQLDAVELATLQSVLFDGEAVEEALALSRREHLNPGFWERQDPDWWWRPSEAVENLRRFQREAGFYAGTAAPMESLNCWSRRALVSLAEASLWSSDLSSGWFLLPIAQELFQRNGRLLPVHQPPDLTELLPLMAGREVLYVGAHAEAVEQQHRSGRSFQLFNDREIAPYGLRCLAPPDSRHPQRPHGSFEESLEVLLEQVESLQRQRPFALVLAAAGAYRLPVLQELRRRHGMNCVGLGANLHQLFGVDTEQDPPWRQGQRRQEHWRRL